MACLFFGCAEASLLCGVFSSCGKWGCSLWCVGFSLQGLLLLQSMGSVVVAHGLTGSLACGIFPEQGSNLCPCVGGWILNHWTTQEALHIF